MANDFFLSQLAAKRQPFLYQDGRVYLIAPGQPDTPDGGIAFRDSSHLLVPGPTITEMVEECVKHKDAPEAVREDAVVHTALYEVAGRLINVLGDKKCDKDRALEEDYLRQYYAKNHGIHGCDISGATKDSAKRCVQELPGANFVYWQGEYHQLRATTGQGDVRFSGRAYNLITPQTDDPVYDLEESINDTLGLCEDDDDDNPYDNLPEEIEFEHFKISFEDNRPRVILKIKPYVLRDYLEEKDDCDEEDDDYYEDDKPKRKNAKPKPQYYAMSELEVSVALNNARQASMVMVETGSCPFGYAEDDLCMGHYNDSYFAKMPYPDAIVKLLLDARKVVLTGYQPNCNPKDMARDCGTEITKKQARHKGLKVTNELGLEARRR